MNSVAEPLSERTVMVTPERWLKSQQMLGAVVVVVCAKINII